MNSHAAPDQAESYKYYVPLTINNRPLTFGLVDSGNTWSCAISADLMKQLNLTQSDLTPIPGVPTVGTAHKDGHLKVLGMCKQPLKISFGDLPTKFSCQPVVLEGLSMPFNISGPYMKKHGIDQLHSEDALRIAGRKVKLVSVLQTKPSAEVGSTGVYLHEKVTVPAQSQILAPVVAAEVAAGNMPSGDGLCDASDGHFMEKHDLHPWLRTAVHCNSSGIFSVGIMNTLDEDITLPKGTRYGSFTLSTDDQTKHPWRVSLISKQAAQPEPVSDPGDPVLQGPTTDANRQARRRLIIDSFKLKNNPLLSDPSHFEQAVQLLLDHFHTFSWDGSPGHTTLIQHEILTDPHITPVADKHRPLNPSLEPQLRSQLDQWLAHGIIQECTSPWNAELVAVAKPNGKVRWCVDYRRLNSQTQKNHVPIGNIQVNLDKLDGSRVFSCLDSAGAFHNIPIRKSDRPKTAFSTPYGQYMFNALPFGLCGAPSTYARLVTRMLHGLPTLFVVPYLDDVLCHSPSVPVHFTHLKALLQAHDKAGLKL